MTQRWPASGSVRAASIQALAQVIHAHAGPHHLVKIGGECGDRYVCVKTYTTAAGTPSIELAVYARIGAYHIYQMWQLNDKGIVSPRVFSKGLSCNLDHWHHPYWRFNVDLDGTTGQRVNIFDGDTLKRLVDQHQSGARDHTAVLWALLMFDGFHRQVYA